MDLHIINIKHSQVLNILLSTILSILVLISVTITYKFMYDLTLASDDGVTLTFLGSYIAILYIILDTLDCNKE